MDKRDAELPVAVRDVTGQDQQVAVLVGRELVSISVFPQIMSANVIAGDAVMRVQAATVSLPVKHDAGCWLITVRKVKDNRRWRSR